MIFPISTVLAGLVLLSSIHAAPTPDSVTLKIGGQEVTISSPGSISVVSSSSSSATNGSAAMNGTAGTNSNAKAIYFMSNVNGSNAVIALKVAANGTLSDGSSTLTGGSGGNGIDSTTKGPAAPDALFSQGAIKVAGNMLVAVNAGDNTMSLFTISPTDSTSLTMIGKPVSTGGEFPVSVTLSTKLSQACVANSGATANLACFSMSPKTGLKPLSNNFKPFALNQTTPPVGPTNTVSQVFFNNDDTALMTTVKGDGTANNTGFLSMIPVCDGVIDGAKEVRMSPNGTAVLFGTANIPNNSSSLFVTDASFGSATISLPPISDIEKNIISAAPEITAKTEITDQKATCWATISNATQTAFVTDVSVNHLVEVDTITGELIKELKLENGNKGMIDLVAVGNYVYALSPAEVTKVVVFDVSGGKGTAKEVQNFGVAGVGINSQGLTFSM